MLGAIASLAVGFLFAAPAAYALSPPITKGGVTCEQYSTGYASYPTTFWSCTANHASPSSAESGVGLAARDKLTTAMKSALANTEIMIFTNATDFANFTGTTALLSKYVAWNAPSGLSKLVGTALASKRIAAVFEHAMLWSPTAPNANVIADRTIDGSYKAHIGQALGRVLDDINGGNLSSPTLSTPTTPNIFAIATEYDQFWANDEGSVTVWGSTLANTKYPGASSWTILENLYGASYKDIYAFQFSREFGTGWSHLYQFITGHLPETEAWRTKVTFEHDTSIVAKTEGYQDTQGQGVFCVEYSTIYAAPADKIYDCLHPLNATMGGERTSGASVGSLDSDLRTPLSNNFVKLYLMRDIRHYGIFHQVTIADAAKVNAWGYSTGVATGVNETAAAFWRQFFTVDYSSWDTAPSSYMASTLVHEVGHHLDGIWGFISALPASNFKNAIDADKLSINGMACTSVFSSARCNAPSAINGTYTSIFNAIPNVDTLPCTQVLAAAVCSGAPAGTNTVKFNAIANRDAQLCNTVLAASKCDSNRKSNWDILDIIYSTKPYELWAMGIQAAAGGTKPAEFVTILNKLTNLKNYMTVNPNVMTNGQPANP